MEEWEIPYHELKRGDEVAHGTFAIVHRGKWRGIDVAIKELKNSSSVVAREDQKNELKIMMLVHHPNIVLFLGYSRPHPQGDLCLVFEWMDGGDLLETIRRRKTTRSQQIRWSIDLCTAVLYLHLRTPTYIIHRDLKPANCLLDRHGMCKIADFGISKSILIQQKIRSRQNLMASNTTAFLGGESSSNHVLVGEFDDDISVQSTGPVGTFRYMAPELMRDIIGEKHSDDDSKSFRSSKNIDIYSLGMILYMIWENREPFWNYTNQINVEDFCSLVRKGLQPHFSYSSSTPLPIREKIRECWNLDPNQRPSAEDLLSLFQSTSSSVRKYSIPTHCSLL